jgi:hypothetical protein
MCEVLMWGLRVNYVFKMPKTVINRINRKYRFRRICNIEADRNIAAKGNKQKLSL